MFQRISWNDNQRNFLKLDGIKVKLDDTVPDKEGIVIQGGPMVLWDPPGRGDFGDEIERDNSVLLSNKKGRTMRNAEDSDLKMFDATSLSQEMSTPDSTNLTGGVQNYTFGPADTENSLATAPLVAASDDSNANRSHLGCGSYTCCSTGFPVATLHCKTSNHVATNRNISPLRLFWVVCSWYRLICRCM